MVGCCIGILNECHDVGKWDASSNSRMRQPNGTSVANDGDVVALWYPEHGGLRMNNTATTGVVWKNDEVAGGGLPYVRMSHSRQLIVDTSVRAFGVNVTLWMVYRWADPSTAGLSTWMYIKSPSTTTSVMGHKYSVRNFVNSQLSFTSGTLTKGVRYITAVCIKQVGPDTILWWYNRDKVFSSQTVLNTIYDDRGKTQLQFWVATNSGALCDWFYMELDDTNYPTSADWVAKATALCTTYLVP